MLGAFIAIMVRSVMVAFGVFPSFHLLRTGSPILFAIALTFGAIGAMTGGYIAGWLHDRAPLVSALALGIVWSCASISMIPIVGSYPAWYRFSMPVVVVVGTTMGGILRVCTSRSLSRGDDSLSSGGAATA